MTATAIEVREYLRAMRERHRVRHLVPDESDRSLCGAFVKRPADPSSDPCVVCEDIAKYRQWTSR